MANEDKKDFNAMLHDNKDMPKFQIITYEKSIEKYGGNASSLLGNLLYAMEYRNQDVELSNGSKMNIPENVIFIFTENTLDARNERKR